MEISKVAQFMSEVVGCWGQIDVIQTIIYYCLPTDDLISIKYCKGVVIGSENCLVMALFL